MNIRPFTPEDYPAISAVWGAVYPDYPETAEEIRHSDETRSAKIKWGRLVAECGGRVVGVGGYGQSHGMYHPQKFFVEVMVLPDEQGQGVGGALYDHVLESLAPHDPIALRTEVREDMERSLRFARARGFEDGMREQESKVDIAAFDPAAFAADLERVEKQGIAIKTFAELKAGTDDQDALFWKLDDLHCTIHQDIPHPDEITRAPHEEFLKRFERPGFLPDGNFYALDGNQVIGGSILWANQSNQDLMTGMTGILRDYRKRGIATALKVQALTHAKERGAPFVRTWNEMNNDGMLNINFRLGFVRQPAWLDMVKTMKEETNEQPD